MANPIKARNIQQTLATLGLALALPFALAWYYEVYVNWQPNLYPLAVVAVLLGCAALSLLTLIARGEAKKALAWKTPLSVAVFAVALVGVSGIINNGIYGGSRPGPIIAASVALPLAIAQLLTLFCLLLRKLRRPVIGTCLAASCLLSFIFMIGVPYMQSQPKWNDGTPEQRALTDRLSQKKWGVFNHYLPASPDLVETIDTQAIAQTLHGIGAGYCVVTMMQGNNVLNAPNETYDRITGRQPGEACARRDLIADLYDSLSKYGIDLYVYFTGDGPYKDDRDGAAFGFTSPVTRPFVEQWACVLEEYALRYGDKVCGWWIDGCYKGAFGYDDELLQIYYDAVKKGNPKAIVAFNDGVKDVITREDGLSDFTAGEQIDFTVYPKERFADGAQWHVLAPLGISPDPNNPWDTWCKFGVKRDGAYLREYINKVNSLGGVVTIDIWMDWDCGTRFDPAQIETLRSMVF